MRSHGQIQRRQPRPTLVRTCKGTAVCPGHRTTYKGLRTTGESRHGDARRVVGGQQVARIGGLVGNSKGGGRAGPKWWTERMTVDAVEQVGGQVYVTQCAYIRGGDTLK